MSHVIRALLARSEWNPGTVMIPQYQFDKTKQHTHKWTGHKKCPVRMNHVTLMNVWRHIQMSYVPHANMLFQIIDWLMLPLSIHEKWFSSFAGTWSSITMKSVSNECIFFMCGGVAAVLAEGRTQKGTMIFKGYNDCKRNKKSFRNLRARAPWPKHLALVRATTWTKFNESSAYLWPIELSIFASAYLALSA